MSVHLHCDGPACTLTTPVDSPDADQWLMAGTRAAFEHRMVGPTITIGVAGPFEPEPPDPDELPPASDALPIVSHYCSTDCIAAWAEWARRLS